MKKITLIELLLLSLMTISISMSIVGKPTEIKELHFQVDMRAVLAKVQDRNTIGIRGNIAPLNWETTYFLADENDDGIYEATINLETGDATVLEFKFVYDNVVWEFATETNRKLDLSQAPLKSPTYKWNTQPPFTPAEIKAMTIPKEKLLEDFELVKTAFTTMHPGLYRYNTPETIDEHLAVLKQQLSKDLTIPAAYIAFSRFTAKIKCGHTYANFWNQPTVVKQAINYQADKVPFHFRIVDNRMIITESANPDLKRGMEVLAINGQPWATILKALMPIMRSDGANDGQRIINLQLLGGDKFEPFDMYFPTLFPPKNGEYELAIQDLKDQSKATIKVSAMSKIDRIQVIKAKFPAIISTTEEEMWQFKILNEQTALLTLHTFSIWNFKMNWKGYLNKVFKTLDQQNIQHLIIDIRYNGGGADKVALKIFKQFADEPIIVPARKVLYRFNEFPATVKPHIGSWDNSFEKRVIKKLKPIEPGFYATNGKISKAQQYQPLQNNFDGKVYLLVSPYNSSATYYMAETAKRQKLATLVGQETGGNQKGINGGQIYFFKLPNSKIELDIPVGGVFPLTEKPDKGYAPDVFVQPNVEDVVNGVDSELAAVLELIEAKKK